MPLSFVWAYGAGNGDRTRTTGLGSRDSTIELYPQIVIRLPAYGLCPASV